MPVATITSGTLEFWDWIAQASKITKLRLGGGGTETPAIGERAGPGFGADEVIPAIERLIHFYLNERQAPSETFLECYRRLGLGPFKAALYETEHSKVRVNAA